MTDKQTNVKITKLSKKRERISPFTAKRVLLEVLTLKILSLSRRHVINNRPCSFVYVSIKQIDLGVFCYHINGSAADIGNLSAPRASI